MKRLFFLLTIATFLFACNSNQQKKTKEPDPNIFKISELMSIAEKNIGKEVQVKGLVEHVCAHSGKRCILIDTTSNNLSIRVEAKGNIKGFNRELAGMTIVVKGTIQEKRLSNKSIDKWEEATKLKIDKEEGGKHCSAELTNIEKMRAWMKENKKDYYAIYFVNGTDYEIIK